MKERLTKIRAELDRLRDADRERRVFGARRIGAHGHDYREEPALDAAALAARELECGAPFPDELREFLLHVHAGGPGPGYGMDVWGERPRAGRPFPYSMMDFECLLARRREERFASLPMPESDENEGECWPPGAGFVALAHHGCGVYDVIIVTGELRGTVWCCDMAWRPYDVDGRPQTFLDWYESWLTWNLSPQSIARLRAPRGR